MFPFSPWASPTGSFQIPVTPPAPAGGSCSTLSVQFPSEWLPYIVGALQQLTLQSTWQGTKDDIVAAQQEAANIIRSIQAAVCVNEAPSGSGGVSCDEECQMCCLRWNNGVLQVFSCGEWTDVPGGGGINPGTPSAGQQQPAANGGSQSICLDLIANQTVPLGVNVSSGDTLLISNLNGTWRDVTSLLGIINCPDGYIYVEGACVADFPSGSPDPVPTALHMGLIAYIDGTAYDVTGVGPFQKDPVLFTVPGGISNKPVFFQANIANLQNANGNVSFCCEVTNNAPGTFTHVFDFTTSTGLWEPYLTSPDHAVYHPGEGWGSVINVPSAGQTVMDIKSPVFSARTITRIEVFYTTDYTQGAGGTRVVDTQPGLANYGALENGTGTFDTIITNTVAGVTQIVMALDNDNGTGTVNARFTKVIVSGIGTDPF